MKTKVKIILAADYDYHDFKTGDIGYIDGYDGSFAIVVVGEKLGRVSLFNLKVIE